MISANNISLRVGKKALFEEVNIKFTEGNCYGLIGANGAGKSTFLKILSGQLEPTSGEIAITPGQRLSFLQQDHFKYDEYTVLDTVIMGNARLYQIMKEKEAIYMKEDFTDEDGIKAAELEGEFATMNGWEAESDAESLLNGLGIGPEFHYSQMGNLLGAQKVKVLLAQALFGNPDILLLDEPTNHLDITSKEILESALNRYTGTVLYVSHDRYFINRTATRILDLTGHKLLSYNGNYAYYLEKKDTVESRFLTDDDKTMQTSAKKDTKEEGKLDWQEQKKLAAKKRKIENEYQKTEQEIEALETDIANLDEELMRPEYACNAHKLNELSTAREEKETALTAAMEQWERLAEQLEEFEVTE